MYLKNCYKGHNCHGYFCFILHSDSAENYCYSKIPTLTVFVGRPTMVQSVGNTGLMGSWLGSYKKGSKTAEKAKCKTINQGFL
jgi:hypothetical protein